MRGPVLKELLFYWRRQIRKLSNQINHIVSGECWNAMKKKSQSKVAGKGLQKAMEALRVAVSDGVNREGLTWKTGSNSSSHKGLRWVQDKLRCAKQNGTGTYWGIRKMLASNSPNAQTAEATSHIALCALGKPNYPPSLAVLSPPIRTCTSFTSSHADWPSPLCSLLLVQCLL